ncbi:MAG: C4-dicarboxylate transporter permease [Devosia sp.]|uniref:tripartite tricarboxylate transporter permease n=1 Tax=Devosia sp. TaxID=1871048 RepID=UPI002602027A|nr:tripartite tricarboxylate transporter permease [Devosia sp.]MDB5541715.1 C4-dicarboxylate transporter permease [Devosia sp.]
MDILSALINAVPDILAWQVVLAMVAGLIGGIVLGAIPGLGAPMGIAMLIPLTYGMEPLVALGMLAGVHNGASFGGAIPAVLLRIPGTTSAIFTTLDGYPLAQKGKAGAAVWLAAVSSAVGGVLSALSLIILAPMLMLVTLAFGPSEIFWVTVFGLASVSILLGNRPGKGVIAAAVGLLISLVGQDRISGQERFTFGQIELLNGPLVVAVLTGIYALPPAWNMIEKALSAKFAQSKIEKPEKGLWTYRQLIPVWLKSSLIGIVVGVLPGSSGGSSSAIAYNETKRASKHPEEFGHGSVEGLAAAEAGNNADNAAAMIPALTLGVPGSGVAALMLGALLIHGLHPGPELFQNAPDVVYGYMLQMLVTSALILPFGGYFATKIFAKALMIPATMLGILIIAVTVLGIYTVNNSMFDVYLLLGSGVLGYFMEKLRYPPAPLVLGLVLGSVAEYNLRLAMIISNDDWTVLFSRPISLIILALIVVVIGLPVGLKLLAQRKRATAR